jgi:DNA gyrase subunit A
VVALKAVHNKDDLMMITATGMIIRTGLDQIRSIGRNTQGVRLIKLKPGDKLVAAEKIIAEDENNGKNNSGDDKKPQATPKDAPTPESKKKDSKKRPKSK